MNEVSAFVERAWREGVGPDDRSELASLAGHDDPELALFAVWLELLAGRPAPVPPELAAPAPAVVRAAAIVMRSKTGEGLDELAAALDRLTDDDAHATAARAWADFALAELAHASHDLATMQRRVEALVVPGRPVALRIAALIRMAGASLTRAEPAIARTWGRRALTLAETSGRKQQGVTARLLLAIIEYVGGHLDATRRLIEPLLADAEVHGTARLLLASIEEPERAMALFGEGVRRAVEQGDPITYLLTILIGSRRYVTLEHRADALVTISAGIVELRKVAPQLARVLEEEREHWRAAWGELVWADAELAAVRLVDNARQH